MGRRVAVDSHAIPVLGRDGAIQGAILLLHDASSETSLEQRCQSLYEKATRDPLTQVANRAEFDRVHEMFVEAHQEQKVPCSLHHVRSGPLQVGQRHLWASGRRRGDSEHRDAAEGGVPAGRPRRPLRRRGVRHALRRLRQRRRRARAEQVRKSLGQMQQPKMQGHSVTASFGVTEIQPGDTPETMLRRSDRALLMAKAKGRNVVVQLGSGGGEEPAEPKRSSWFGAGNATQLIEQTLVTPVPLQMTIEKLRGFVADHRAAILKIDGNQVQLETAEKDGSRLRRITDRPVVFLLNLRLEEERVQKEEGENAPQIVRTKIAVAVSLRRERDRRRKDVADAPGGCWPASAPISWPIRKRNRRRRSGRWSVRSESSPPG